MKHLTRWLIKAPLLLSGTHHFSATPGCTFLIYHSVTDRIKLELDLTYDLFRRQLYYLTNIGQIISYEQALAALQAGQTFEGPTFVLTFDDGYLDFYTHVYPLLRQLQVPATLFVTTGFVEDQVPYPLWGRNVGAVAPVTWTMLGEMAASGLVTLGAHTHTHPVLDTITHDQLTEELIRPLKLFQNRLQMTPVHFAYPKAIWAPAIEAMVMRYYQSAAVGGVAPRQSAPARGGAQQQSAPPRTGAQQQNKAVFHPYRIPRLPIRRSDQWFFFRAKAHGWLAGEEAIYERLHRLTTGAKRLQRRFSKKVGKDEYPDNPYGNLEYVARDDQSLHS